MSRMLWIFVACFTVGTAYAGAAKGPTFSQRVQAAKRAEQQAKPREYLKANLFTAVKSVLAKDMPGCLGAPGASLETFALVADVDKDGKLSDVDVNPRTNTSQCFAAAFAKVEMPPPPTSGNAKLPIAVDLKLKD